MSEIKDGVECPFCGSPTVTGIMLTEYMFKSEHRLSKSGIVVDTLNCIGDYLGEIADGYPTQKLVFFECETCGKKWSTWDYKYLRSEDGKYEFVKVKKARKGAKKE